MKRTTLRGLTATIAIGIIVLVPSLADAHFTLVTPESARTQDAVGSPQKLGPCGDESGGMDTGKVTAYQAGATIDVTIDEKIFHPGHYRVALSVNDRSELPAEPPVTAGSTACGSVPIAATPAVPVLADGVLEHKAAFSGPQTMKVTLPSNVTCAHCTLQVIEFMSDHGLNIPGGCFYHHCADISIQASAVDGGTTPDASTGGGTGTGGGDGGNVPAADGSSGGCSVSLPSKKTAATMAGIPFLLFAFGALLRRRRAP
jgi:MYXO-CTERM domain-containing protein